MHLMSPEDSPTVRVSKKARRSLFQLGDDKEEQRDALSREPLEAAASIPGIKGKRLFGNLAKKAGAAGNVLDEAADVKPVEEPLKEPRRRLRPTNNNRVLMRMMGSGTMTGLRTAGSHHCLGKLA